MKSGFVAVAGRPNVGKSTLVNALTGTKVAIVSDKPHTTRHQIRGVHTDDEAQLVLVDLPGWQKPIDTLTERMQDRVDETMASDVDAIMLVVDARERIGAGDRYVARRVFGLGIPVVIVLRLLGSYLPGFGSITIAVLLLGGIQLIAIGIIGEYVGRIYDEVKGRPLYLVRSRLNFPEEETPRLPFSPVAAERERSVERRRIGF